MAGSGAAWVVLGALRNMIKVEGQRSRAKNLILVLACPDASMWLGERKLQSRDATIGAEATLVTDHKPAPWEMAWSAYNLKRYRLLAGEEAFEGYVTS